MSQFVGRVAQLDAARLAFRTAGTRAFLVVGEPGSGKSRLLTEIVGELPAATVLRVQGHEPEAVIPWAAAGEMLAELSLRDAALAGAVAEPREAPLLLLEAAHRALARSARPAVIVVDDAQWLDSYSRALLHYLVRAAGQDGGDVLLLAAGRPEETTVELFDSLVGLMPAESVTSVEVGPFTREEGVSLLRSVRPGLDDETAVQLWRLAAGSPFWLGLLAKTDGASATLGAVRARLRASGTDAVTVLGLLSVAARPLPAEALGTVLDWDAGRARAAVATLVHGNLATHAAGRITVVHDLVREIVVADLVDETRRSHELRLADWFAREDDPSALLLAARHLAAAGEDPVHLAYRAAAGHHGQRLGVDGLEQLVRICDTTTHPGSADLAMRLAELATAMREPSTAGPLWQRLADEHPEGSVRQRAALEAARAAYQLDDAAQARHWLGRARDSCSPGSLQRIRVDVLDCHVNRWMEGRFDEAAQAAASASAAAVALDPDDPEVRTVLHEILEARSDGALMAADYGTMDSVTQEMTRLAHGDADREYTAAVYRIDALSMMERPREAERISRRYWTSAMDSGHPTRALEMGAGLLDALLDQGRAGEAATVMADVARLLTRVTDLGGRITTGGGMPTVSRTVHWARAMTGDLRAAKAAMVAELDAGGTHLGSSSLLLLADVTCWLGPPGEESLQSASQLADRALSAAVEVGCPRCTEESRIASARLRALLGDCPTAQELLAAARSARRIEPAPPVVRQLRWADAAVLSAQGRTAEAADGLSRLREEYAAQGLHLSWLFAGLDLAEVLAGGSPQAALDVLDDISSSAERMGATNIAASAGLRMRRLGARPWRRGPSCGSDLSDRERSVVELLATGASNPEIAAALFLSRKTVERHVSNIIAKLGVRNRAEVVATMVPRGPGGGLSQPSMRDLADDRGVRRA